MVAKIIMPAKPPDVRRGSAPNVTAVGQREKAERVKGRIAYTRASTFHHGTTHVVTKGEYTAGLQDQAGPRIVVDQSDDLTAAEAREFAHASLGAFNIQTEELDSSGGVKDMLSPSTPGDIEVLQNNPINLVVIGSTSNDRKAFVRKALDLPSTGPAFVTEREVPVDGQIHHVRLFELPIQDVSVDDEEVVEWPDSIDERIDGALTLVDVTEKSTYENVPGVLSAINKASLPSVLVSTKCDAPAGRRQMDIDAIEKRAKKAIEGLETVQASDSNPDDHKRAMFLILRAIVSGTPRTFVDKHPSSSAYWVTGMLSAESARTRQRAQSSATRPVSPGQHHLGHSRASSELTRSALKCYPHVRHDSSLGPRGSNNHIDHYDPFRDDAYSGFSTDDGVEDILGDQYGIVASRGSSHVSTMSSSECGVTFDSLIDRLLSNPTSKADGKLATIFLALYRKFAAPGRLLEGIVQRFDSLDRNDAMIKTVEQMRLLSILEQWISSYPGDFAYLQTRQRMRNFIARIAQLRIFAVAAKEMGVHLDMVREDDDTIWEYTDFNRNVESERNEDRSPNPSSRFSNFSNESRKDFFDNDRAYAKFSGSDSDIAQSLYTPSTTLPSLHLSFESAQQQALLSQPSQRQPLSKLLWRALIDVPDDMLAQELTRIDWTLFAAARSRDMVRHISLKKDEAERYKNIVFVIMMIDHFNHIATWASNFILLRDKPKHRAMMLEKFMRVARRLRELNNYNALGAIIAGVKSTPVYRLAATRDLIPPNISKDWLKLEILMSPTKSHFAYRLAWENTSGERIPYLPLHRRDLVSAEEGNKTFIGDPSLDRINWKKFEVMGEVIVGFQRVQGMPFKSILATKPDTAIRELILDVRLQKDEDALYERSLQCEPVVNTSGPSQKIKDFFKR